VSKALPIQGDPDPKTARPHRRDPKKYVKEGPKEDPKIDPKIVKKDPPETYVGAIYPRRALLISVCDYAMAGPLVYGKPAMGNYLGANQHALAARLEQSVEFPANQIAELSDKAAKPTAPRKAAIEETLVDFLNTSRSQDCILVVFSGHVVEIDKEAYLVPVEGRLGAAKTLISFDWLLDKLARCKAHQKVLVLDIGHGAPIGEVLYSKIAKPPEHVRVWTSCIKGERALDGPDGSLFLEALCHSCKNLELKSPKELIPIETIARKVDQYVQDKAKAKNHKQTTAVLGTDRPGSVPYNAKEAPPPAVAIKAPAVPDVPSPERAELTKVLEEINRIPQPTSTKLPALNPANLEIPAKLLELYKADYDDLLQFKNDRQKPLRAAVADAIVGMQKAASINMRQTLGNADVNLKKQLLAEQMVITEQLLPLKDALTAMMTEAVSEERGKETKRWQVLYDFVLLRAKARYVFVMDYNFIVGQFRGDAQKPLGQGDKLWRLTPQERLSTTESTYKQWAKDVAKGWDKLQKNFPETPWAIEADRQRAIILGLAWQPAKN
jgi:Caspase domain